MTGTEFICLIFLAIMSFLLVLAEGIMLLFGRPLNRIARRFGIDLEDDTYEE